MTLVIQEEAIFKRMSTANWLIGFDEALRLLKNELVEAQQHMDDASSLAVMTALIIKVDELQKNKKDYAPDYEKTRA